MQDETADSLMNFEYFDEKIEMLQERERQLAMNENSKTKKTGSSDSAKKKARKKDA